MYIKNKGSKKGFVLRAITGKPDRKYKLVVCDIVRDANSNAISNRIKEGAIESYKNTVIYCYLNDISLREYLMSVDYKIVRKD